MSTKLAKEASTVEQAQADTPADSFATAFGPCVESIPSKIMFFQEAAGYIRVVSAMAMAMDDSTRLGSNVNGGLQLQVR